MRRANVVDRIDSQRLIVVTDAALEIEYIANSLREMIERTETAPDVKLASRGGLLRVADLAGIVGIALGIFDDATVEELRARMGMLALADRVAAQQPGVGS